MVLRYISSVNIGNLGNSEGSRVLNALEGQWTAGYRLRDELLNSRANSKRITNAILVLVKTCHILKEKEEYKLKVVSYEGGGCCVCH